MFKQIVRFRFQLKWSDISVQTFSFVVHINCVHREKVLRKYDWNIIFPHPFSQIVLVALVFACAMAAPAPKPSVLLASPYAYSAYSAYAPATAAAYSAYTYPAYSPYSLGYSSLGNYTEAPNDYIVLLPIVKKFNHSKFVVTCIHHSLWLHVAIHHLPLEDSDSHWTQSMIPANQSVHSIRNRTHNRNCN